MNIAEQPLAQPPVPEQNVETPLLVSEPEVEVIAAELAAEAAPDVTAIPDTEQLPSDNDTVLEVPPAKAGVPNVLLQRSILAARKASSSDEHGLEGLTALRSHY